MAEEEGKTTVEGEVEENFIGTFKDKAAAEEGWANLETKLAAQGNEVGELRKQGETSQRTINDLQNQLLQSKQPTPEPAQDYGKEKSAIQKELSKLDTVDESYHKDMLALTNKLASVVAKEQHEKTLTAATTAFTKELDERDVKATHNAFYKNNPDFDTPEMQARIKEQIKSDSSGMSDPLVAYREIQRDEAMQQAAQMAEENTKLKELANLKKGTDATGKVFTDTGQTTAKQTKTMTRAERDAAMMEAVNNAA